MAVYSRKSERSFNAILDLLDRKHLLHMRVYRDSLLKNRGMLIYTISARARGIVLYLTMTMATHDRRAT